MAKYDFLKQYKSVLCLNSDLIESAFFNYNLPIIAADGAANKLINIGVKPNIIIGDLDSVNINSYHLGAQIINLPQQDKSDFQKALAYIKKNNLLPTIITGVNGGFIDHILNNINIILSHDCAFYAPPILGYAFKAPYIFNAKLNIATKLSLFGIEKAKVTSSGLKWELNNAALTFPGNNSLSNRTITDNITIEVIEGNLLLLIYIENIIDQGLF